MSSNALKNILKNFEKWIFPGHLEKGIFFNYHLKSENFPNFEKSIFIHKNYTCMQIFVKKIPKLDFSCTKEIWWLDRK